MTDQTHTHQNKRPFAHAAIFALGILLLAASWMVLFGWIALFTEAMLVPWYCCALETLPPPGSWQRAVNDFFHSYPGSILPSLLFILISIAVFARRMRLTKNKIRLPLIYFFANVILLAAGMASVEASWAVSNAIVGPRLGGIDAGFHRTWYGIVSQLLLWSLFFILLARLKLSRPGKATARGSRPI